MLSYFPLSRRALFPAYLDAKKKNMLMNHTQTIDYIMKTRRDIETAMRHAVA
jgi:hypothetical protein